MPAPFVAFHETIAHPATGGADPLPVGGVASCWPIGAESGAVDLAVDLFRGEIRCGSLVVGRDIDRVGEHASRIAADLEAIPPAVAHPGFGLFAKESSR